MKRDFTAIVVHAVCGAVSAGITVGSFNLFLWAWGYEFPPAWANWMLFVVIAEMERSRYRLTLPS